VQWRTLYVAVHRPTIRLLAVVLTLTPSVYFLAFSMAAYSTRAPCSDSLLFHAFNDALQIVNRAYHNFSEDFADQSLLPIKDMLHTEGVQGLMQCASYVFDC